MLTVSDRLPEHRPTACVSSGANNTSRTIDHMSHEGKWRVVFVGPMARTAISPAKTAGV
ncbi:hypothetical protein AB0C15_14175 [Micromonospora sp. NPDC048835]|uniref:hypothetical protein n=1 Tax=Micromonospora sp. NPDC048835 TaxID=3155147 RepID=UPI0034018234